MAQRKRLQLGNSDFKNIMTANSYFVDKSLLIKEVIDTENSILLFPRPRRFGKTLNLSMLKSFFDKNETENYKLFEGLKIWQAESYIKKECGKYPVISLSFKDTKSINWEKTLSHIKLEIIGAYHQHIYLLKSDVLYDFEKHFFNKILTKQADEADFEVSLKVLCDYLYRYHKQNVVILIDEYDTPIQSGYKKYYEEVVSFMRNLLSGAFKDNSYLHKGIITGILRVSKESIFSGLNNLSVFSVLDDEFSDKFGFTEEEVKQIIKDFDKKTNYPQIKKWYNGYKFGKTEGIYNPWSILNFVLSKKERFKTFWTNTSANELIKNEIKKKDADNIRQQILKLINNEVIVKDIEENFVFTDFDIDNELLWTLLMYSGYLTTRKMVSRKEYELVIPNYELKTIFQDTIIKWLQSDVRVLKSLIQSTANHLINNRIADFEEGFKQIIGDTFSYYDTAKNNEYVYQSYILGLLAIIGDDYIIKSNKESGGGRYDIMLIPHDKSKNGVVIEIKQIKKRQKSEKNAVFIKRINKQIKSAIEQIDSNKYYKELIENKIAAERIIKVPIVFAGKEPYINLLSKLEDLY